MLIFIRSMKMKLFIWAAILLLSAIVIDFYTMNYSKDDSFTKIHSYVENHFNDAVEKVIDPKFLHALDKKEGAIQDFNMFENKIKYFEDHQMRVTLRKNGEDLFWTSHAGFNDVCKDSLANGYSVRVCFNLFNDQGNLYHNIANNFDVIKNINLSDDSRDFLDFGQGKIMVETGKTRRSAWLLILILGLYGLSFFTVVFRLKEDALKLMAFLITLRIILYFLPIEFHFLPLQLFENKHGFSAINKSMADYLINAIFLFISSVVLSRELTKINKVISPYAIAGLLVAGTSLIIVLMHSASKMIFHSNLNFDFEDLSQLGSLELIGLTALSVNAFSLFVFNQSIYNLVSKQKLEASRKYIFFAGAVTVTTLLSLVVHTHIPILWLITFLIVMVILFDLFSDIKSKNIAWLIWWMIVFSGFLSAILYSYNVRNDLKERQVSLKDKYHFSDGNALKKYQKSFEKIVENGSIDQIINKPANVKYNTDDIAEFIQYKIPNLENTSILILPFDHLGNPLAINQFENVQNFQNELENFEKELGNWYFDPIQNRYWTFEEVKIEEQSQRIYFGFNEKEDHHLGPNFPISLFKNQIPILDLNNLNFEEKQLIYDNKEKEKTIFNGANAYVIYQPHEGTYLVSKKTFAGLIKPIALFSLIFTIIGLIVLTLALANSYIKILPSSIPLKLKNINSFSLRIQLVIVILIMISFLGIAWVTVTFINDFINNNENQLIESKILSISKDMNLKMREEANFTTSLQVINGSLNAFESIHRSEIDIFKKNGLKVNHQDRIKLDFLPYYYFNKIKSNYPFTIRNKKSEPNSYFLLKHHSGNDAIISVSSNEELKASKLSLFDFLGSIVNVYVFLFLIAGAISIAVARSISRPLSALGDKMKQLKLGTTNERLEWKSEDEIGALIHNYNDMVMQLEESAVVLAKTQRDMAWREMARQVAHEIKNPLTPMKLRIQYLEKAMKSDSEEDLRPMIKRISETLLLQINNLSEIADSFSNFAQLPTANNEKISLNEVVETIHDLFRKREDMDIRLVEPIDSIMVYADKNHLIRVLNNLVKNAIEAIPDNKKGEIIITLSKNERSALIRVSDNGIGIPEELKRKVFTPNFTTKNSGSGLGLAIAVNMLETFNSKMYFESNDKEGTDFVIVIPLIRPGQFSDINDRIELD